MDTAAGKDMTGGMKMMRVNIPSAGIDTDGTRVEDRGPKGVAATANTPIVAIISTTGTITTTMVREKIRIRGGTDTASAHL